MAPLNFLKASNASCKVSLSILHDAIALCVSGIGSAESFVQTIVQVLLFGSFFSKLLDKKFFDSFLLNVLLYYLLLLSL